jgi:hypothetical protein
MFRIDEIYQSVFWPWFQKNKPQWRVQFCDPFGRSDPDSVLNYGCDTETETNYTFFFDQEPIHLDLHLPTFDKVKNILNPDIHKCHGSVGNLITSEFDSDTVRTVCSQYGWKSYYYFFHGWAALDWYRGYDKTFLITHWQQRKPTKTFLAPNRIIAGARHHRLKILYWIFKMNMLNNHISCPLVCPAENISTEKTFKPIAMGMPFVIVSTHGSLQYLKRYGFKTFDSVWDEGYDLEPDDDLRIEKIAQLVKSLDSLSVVERLEIFDQCIPIIEYNWNHFYNGGFEKILWQELTDMLEAINAEPSV